MCETPDQIISAINALSVPARKELSQKVHNTAEGRSAYVAFNYGMGEPATAPDTGDGNGDGGSGDNSGGGSDNTNTGSGSGDNNTSPTNQTTVNHYENNYSESNETNTTTNSETNTTTNTETHQDDHSENTNVNPQTTGSFMGDQANAFDGGQGIANQNNVNTPNSSSTGDAGIIPSPQTGETNINPTISPQNGDVHVGPLVSGGSTGGIEGGNPTVNTPSVGDVDIPVQTAINADGLDTDDTLGGKLIGIVENATGNPRIDPASDWSEHADGLIPGGGEQ